MELVKHCDLPLTVPVVSNPVDSYPSWSRFKPKPLIDSYPFQCTPGWFSKRKGTSVDNGGRSKNTVKKLGRESRPLCFRIWCSETFWNNVPFLLLKNSRNTSRASAGVDVNCSMRQVSGVKRVRKGSTPPTDNWNMIDFASTLWN